jgi:hypothetical protein
MALPDAIVSASGCTGSTDVLAGFTCGPGLPGSAAEVLLNWPLLLVRAPILTASGFVSRTAPSWFSLRVSIQSLFLASSIHFCCLQAGAHAADRARSWRDGG